MPQRPFAKQVPPRQSRSRNLGSRMARARVSMFRREEEFFPRRRPPGPIDGEMGVD